MRRYRYCVPGIPFDSASKSPAIDSGRHAVATTIQKVASCRLLVVFDQTAPCAQSLSNKSISLKGSYQGRNASLGGRNAPSGGGNASSGGSNASSGGSNASSGGSNAPSGGRNAPSGGSNAPSGGRNAPSGGSNAPSGGRNAPYAADNPLSSYINDAGHELFADNSTQAARYNLSILHRRTTRGGGNTPADASGA